MKRKWIALAVTFASSAMLVAGIAIADDKESPLAKVMEKVQAKHTGIIKAYRTPVAWKKAQKDVVAAAEDMIKLAKDAKPLGGDVIKEKKKTQKDWDEKMDAFMKEAEDFAKTAGKADLSNADAKKAYMKVSATCTNCHNDYRSDEE